MEQELEEGGLAGMTAALYLADAGKTVLLLEKEPALGGLAFGGERRGLRFNRGAAYWTAAYDEELEILKRLGLGDYKQLHAIPEPIDTYLWDGVLYPGIWEEESLARLPASFALFKHELLQANTAQMIPNQPIEESGQLDLDWLDAAEWIRTMPAQTALREDPRSKEIYARFLSDPKVDREEPMKDVLAFMDRFCRSALGTTTGRLSALAFANFYISEIETRYTTPAGTGGAAERLERLLRESPRVDIATGAAVTRLESRRDGVEAVYSLQGRARAARARYAVFSGQLKFAPRIVAGLAQADPEKAETIGRLEYAHFSIHLVFTRGHPYRLTYDTWLRPKDEKPEDPTDVILGRWMDPTLKAYEGYRDFKKDPPDDDGILAIYHPLDLARVGKGYTREEALALAEEGVERLRAMLAPVLKDNWGTVLDIRSVETNRWPYSIHIAAPGHFRRSSRILRRPVGRVFFANNNQGTPAFEEALFRGHCAADNILLRLDAAFKPEPWTRCPVEN